MDAGGPTTTCTYTIKDPTGVFYTGAGGSVPGYGTLGPPNREIGCAYALMYEIQPTDVSFINANMGEIVTGATTQFPDGEYVITPGGTYSWIIPGCSGNIPVGQDRLAMALASIQLIAGATSTTTITLPISYNYTNALGSPVTFGGTSCHHDFYYQVDGATYANAVTGVSSVSTASAPQGPWQ